MRTAPTTRAGSLRGEMIFASLQAAPEDANGKAGLSGGPKSPDPYFPGQTPWQSTQNRV